VEAGTISYSHRSRHARLWGVVTPTETVGLPDVARHILDPMVGEPATYVQGSSSLKVVGTDLCRFTNSPIARAWCEVDSGGAPRSTSGEMQMTKGTVVGLIATISLTVSGANASASPAGLDVPIAPTTPTVRSEIKRGADTVDRCSRQYVLPTYMDGFVGCVDAAQSNNRRDMKAGYEAFDAGLYFMAKTNLGVDVDILSESGRDASLLRARFNLFDVRYRQARDALHLTDADVSRAAW